MGFVISGRPTYSLVFCEVLVGYYGIFCFTTGVWLVSQQLQQPSLGLLRVPGESVTIDVDTCCGGCVDIVFHRIEVHIAIAIHTTCHLHGIACNRLGEIGIGHLVDQSFLEIVIDGCTDAQLEVRVLLIANVILEPLVIIQVAVGIVVRLAQLEFLLFLCNSKGR